MRRLGTIRTLVMRNKSDFFMRSKKLPDFVIEDFAREGQLTTFSGGINRSKSPQQTQIAFCRLHGIPWCGREVKKGSVIYIDFENNASKFRKDIYALANRFNVPVPTVPEEWNLEVYFEHDEQGSEETEALFDLMEKPNAARIAFLEEGLIGKPDALIIIDPFEMFFSLDKNKAKEVMFIYRKLRELLSRYPKAMIWGTFNQRKKDQRAKAPNIITDTIGWLENCSGANEIQTRSDLRLGIDMWDEENNIRVIHGIRRGEKMEPIFNREVVINGELSGFEEVTNLDLTVKSVLTPTQLGHWKKLPGKYNFKEGAEIVPKVTLSRIHDRTLLSGFLNEEDGVFRKVA